MLLVVDERIPDRPSRAAADGIVHAQSDFWQRRSHDPRETRLQIRSSGREDDNSYPNSLRPVPWTSFQTSPISRSMFPWKIHAGYKLRQALWMLRCHSSIPEAWISRVCEDPIPHSWGRILPRLSNDLARIPSGVQLNIGAGGSRLMDTRLPLPS